MESGSDTSGGDSEDGDVTTLIKTGDEVVVDPEQGVVTILNG